MDWIEIVRLLLELIGVSAIVATRLPTSSRNNKVDRGLRIAHAIAMNLGKARNR